MAILGGSIAILGEASRIAFRNALESKEMVQAELLAESLMAKIRIGLIDMEPATDVPLTNMASQGDLIEDTNAVVEGSTSESLWLYTIEVNDIDDDGLIELAVTVRRNLPDEQRHVACRLVRWVALEPEEEETAE